MKKLVFLLIVLFSGSLSAAEGTLQNANITSIRTYETSDDSVTAWLLINGSSRVGPNPANPSVTCELWTNTNTVYSTALAALAGGKKVNIWYVDRGDQSYWCNVRVLEIVAD